ncbi:MAG: DUF2703 domain-containing protein [Nitrospiria bacterium]
MQETVRNKVSQTARQRINIDFLYIDLEVCERCIKTNANLEAALSEVSHFLEMAGVEVALRKILVTSEVQAQAFGFFSSPTLRVNGKDIALEFRESRCASCEACACNGMVNCRVWVFQGKEYNEAPKAMIIDAILREVYSHRSAQESSVQSREVPEDLRRFFKGKAAKTARGAAEESPCCPPAEQAVCCEASDKPVCCGAPHTKSCGCE